MRRPLRTALATGLLAVSVAAAGAGASACGGTSTASAQTQAAATAAPQAAGQMGDPSAMFTKQLDALVTKGTITSAQESAVATALKNSMPTAPSGAGSSGTQPTPGTQPSAGATPPSGAGTGPSGMFTTALDKLVKAGTITSAQETAIVSALSSGMGAPGGAPSSPSSTSAQTTTT